jgi:hypothetical protein
MFLLMLYHTYRTYNLSLIYDVIAWNSWIEILYSSFLNILYCKWVLFWASLFVDAFFSFFNILTKESYQWITFALMIGKVWIPLWTFYRFSIFYNFFPPSHPLYSNFVAPILNHLWISGVMGFLLSFVWSED